MSSPEAELPPSRERRSGTLQQRITRLVLFWVSVSVVFMGVLGYVGTARLLNHQLDSDLINLAGYMTGPVRADVAGMGGLNNAALQAANVNVVLVSANQRVTRVADQPVVINPGPPEVAIARTQLGYSTRTVQVGDAGVRYRVVAVPMSAGGESYALVLARPLAPVTDTLGSLAVMLAIGGVALITLGGSAAYLIGGLIARPLRELSAALTRVTETDELVPFGYHADDEMGELSRNFDTMMNSLASSRDRQKRLIADAGHELRTPLTSMRTNVELLVADEKAGMLPPGARAEILGDIAAQLGEFTSLVGDLVQLSREEPVQAAPEPLDFADVVEAAVARARRRGPNLNFDVRLNSFYVVGEPATLERAVTNLLDNAVKFSPDGGTVHVHLDHDVLTISDEGPGIAEEDLPHIFDRFYRSNKARNTPGTGLGLSIVAHTINAHGGTVGAANASGAGALFTVKLPPAPPEDVPPD